MYKDINTITDRDMDKHNYRVTDIGTDRDQGAGIGKN